MSNLPSQYPTLGLHLTDRALAPLITSARNPDQLGALVALSQTALAAHETVQHLGLGLPQRIMVEHDDGPVLLQSFLRPARPRTANTPPPVSPRPSSPSHTRHSPSAAAAQLASLSVAGPNSAPGSGTNGQMEHTNPRPRAQPRQQQHQGAIALAVQSRNAGESGATASTSYLRDHTPSPTDEEDYHRNPSYYRTDARQHYESEPEPHSARNPHPVFIQDDLDTDDEDDPSAPPMLIGITIAPSSDQTREARRAAARLETVGREIQAHWSDLQEDQPSQRPGQGDTAID
ncbi:hypothetical protein GGS20DRAFT_568199 [Poronia punctata]|nr:hypothetical protein GGS20DRAFT_568199 [Poronia punctata]